PDPDPVDGRHAPAVPRPHAALDRPDARVDRIARPGKRPAGRRGRRRGAAPEPARAGRAGRAEGGSMNPIPIVAQPSFLPADWWALGAVIALSAGAMILLLLEFIP